MAKKAGRPANHWTDSVTGEVVNGLARRPSTADKPGRFYAIGHNKTFGTDEQIAIRRFHAWKQDGTTGTAIMSPMELPLAAAVNRLTTIDYGSSNSIPLHFPPHLETDEQKEAWASDMRRRLIVSSSMYDVPEHLPPSASYGDCDYDQLVAIVTALQKERDQQLADIPKHLPFVRSDALKDRFSEFMVATGRSLDLAEGEKVDREGFARHWPAFLEWGFANWIKEKPKEAAARLGIPELANLEAIKPRPPSMPLAKIAEKYERRSSGRKLYNRESARLFRRFTKIVGVRTVRDIEDEHIEKYEKRILDEFHRVQRGDAWLTKRFHGIRRVFRHARKRSADRDDITRVLGLCEMLEIPKSTESAERAPEPNPITREHLHAVLGLADVRQTAIIITAVNCLYLPIDFTRIPENVIDFDAGTIYFPRVKPRTKIPRVAVLWKRTLTALQAYRDEYPHDARDSQGRKVLIVTNQLKPLTENSHTWFAKWWKSLRDRAGLPANVTFKTLRSGGYTEACQVSRDQAEVLAGHHLPGKTDHYLKRNPKFVAPACRAIEKHYFG